ncbi:carboxylesterase family protein [Robbsia sp. Bb-Pol-6]|uniref:Carboxylic ester hydrolase n=1 Tax=Robbsia betulipollinis TaxID=2981849 RepID=A0ABT3ZTG9_9BURK|nr:carboxylesterase family protein [Robbsia betulipollinis]MCY0389537.1 carboxylesterase family protein [Robbsia betulipollinis]
MNSMPIVSTQNGQLQGERDGALTVFRGIPYAAPPVDALRWRAPVPPSSWNGVRAATAFGPSCLQKSPRRTQADNPAEGTQGEDCLTLNVWAPANAGATEPLPVMVWLHGGSFRFGAGSLPVHDGGELAKRGAVIVTINYRLGLFGTFAHPALREKGEPGGNYGLLDAIAALRWVRDNIAAFGGDPRAVTLFGESAGGVSVGYLMASPLAQGLFQRAIIQSGGLSLPEYARAEAEAIALKTSDALGATTAEALRALPAEAIRDAATDAADTMPFIDGAIVREKGRAAFAAGRIQHVPLLVGYNDAEAGFFGPAYWQSLPRQVGEDAWGALRHHCFGYGATSEDAAAEQVASELFAGVNTRAFARGASAAAPVYAYRFAWVPPEQRAAARGAIHTAEIPYVFGHVPRRPGAEDRSHALSSTLADRWVAFARTGVPTTNPVDWPRFEAGSRESLLLIGPDTEKVGPNPAAGLLDTLDGMQLPPRP